MFTTGAYGCAAGPGFAFLELQNFLIGLSKKFIMQRQTPIFQEEVRDGPGRDEQ